jgi:hypothetical protein
MNFYYNKKKNKNPYKKKNEYSIYLEKKKKRKI